MTGTSTLTQPNVYSSVFGLVFCVSPLGLLWGLPIGAPVAFLAGAPAGLVAVAGVWYSEGLYRLGERWHRLTGQPTESVRAALAFAVPLGVLLSVTNVLTDAELSQPTPRFVALNVVIFSVLTVGAVGLRSVFHRLQ